MDYHGSLTTRAETNKARKEFAEFAEMENRLLSLHWVEHAFLRNHCVTIPTAWEGQELTEDQVQDVARTSYFIRATWERWVRFGEGDKPKVPRSIAKNIIREYRAVARDVEREECTNGA